MVVVGVVSLLSQQSHHGSGWILMEDREIALSSGHQTVGMVSDSPESVLMTWLRRQLSTGLLPTSIFPQSSLGGGKLAGCSLLCCPCLS